MTSADFCQIFTIPYSCKIHIVARLQVQDEYTEIQNRPEINFIKRHWAKSQAGSAYKKDVCSNETLDMLVMIGSQRISSRHCHHVCFRRFLENGETQFGSLSVVETGFI